MPDASAGNRRVIDLIKEIEDGSLILKPAFQRRLVWTNSVKDHFLETVMKGFPFPEIFTATGELDTRTRRRKSVLVDGQQRMSALKQYVEGAPDLKLTTVKPYSELSEAEKTDFLDYKVAVRDLGTVSEAEVKEIFARINSTDYALNAMERLNAQFNGEYKNFCDNLSRHAFFDQHDVFSYADVRRMRDLDFCVILVTTLLSTYYHRDEFNREYLKRYNDKFPGGDSLGKQIDATFDFIDRCNFDKKCRVWKKTDLLTLVIELQSLLGKGADLDPKQIGSRLTKFYDQVNSMYAEEGSDEDLEKKAPNPNVFRYLKAATKATNDKYARTGRAEIIASVIQGSVPPKPKKPATKRTEK